MLLGWNNRIQVSVFLKISTDNHSMLIDRVLMNITDEATIEAVRKGVNTMMNGRPLFKW